MFSDQRFGLDRRVTLPGPLALDGGGNLSPVEIAYETYGELDADRSNAVLICHALTGDQHVASAHPRTGCCSTIWASNGCARSSADRWGGCRR